MFFHGFRFGKAISLVQMMRKALGVAAIVLLSVIPLGSAFGAEGGGNRINRISIDESTAGPVVKVQTREPVGFRYTVYDSQNPRRIIVDFRDMAIGEVPESIAADIGVVREVRTSSFDLTSGQLARIEILLTGPAEYAVSLEGDVFQVALTGSDSAEAQSRDVTEEADEVEAPSSAQVDEGQTISQEQDEPFVTVASRESSDRQATAQDAAADSIDELDMHQASAEIVTNGTIDQYRYFTLTGPSRLVVDVYGVTPDFKERAFSASNGFKRVRVGVYDNKTRFVFDSAEEKLKDFVIDTAGSNLVVDWSGDAEMPAEMDQQIEPARPVAIEDVVFSLDDGDSILTVDLSSSNGRIIKPAQDGNLVRFGVKNATISRSLRRIIDASVFPSSVRIVTPYTVQVNDSQDVMFAVELKGPAKHELKREGENLHFVVNNGPFAEEPFEPKETKPVAVPEKAVTTESIAAGTVAEQAAETEGGVAKKSPTLVPGQSPEFAERDIEIYDGEYSGKKISLVFDDADIRNILQLIADVSDLNIIATEEVQGSLSIRLIDVPWDQALDIVLDIKNLGMIKSGNVVRILPKDKIREMERADLQAARTREDLEPLVTEVISVNYTDLGSVTGPAQNILSDRGKITEDSRNKQLIVTDVSSRVKEIKNLVSILDTPEKQVVIEARIVEANSSFTRDLGVSWGLSYDANGSNGAGEADLFNLGLGGSFVIPPPSQGSVGSAGLASGITFGRVGIDSTTLDLRISALESSGHGKVISTPRVTTLNGKQASISQGTKIPYQSVGDEGTTTEFIDAVLSLDVVPVINPDESIIMEIDASNSSVGSIVPTGSGSAPSVDTKEATTQVLVQNGETTVIGGIFVEDEDYAETGVPLLRSIPILGHLFKSTTKSTVRNELLIFITPRIVNRVD